MKHSVLFDSSKHPVILGKSQLTCVILANQLRVCTVYSLQKALGYDGKFEKWLFEFITDISQINTVNPEILSTLENPLQIELPSNKNSIENAINCQYIVPILEAIITVKNKKVFNSGQLKIYSKALDLHEKLKNVDIETFIDEKIGFKIYKEKIVEKNCSFIENLYQEPAIKWTQTIPISFFDSIFEMNKLNWNSINQNQELFVELINEIVLSRIEEPLLNELRNLKPKRTYKRKNDLKQEIQHPKLQEYLAVINSIIIMSGKNWNIFNQLLNKAFPKQKNRNNLNLHHSLNKEESFSDFNEKLKKSFMIKK